MRIFRKFIPPDQWKVPVIIMLGVFTGLGLFVFDLSKAPSYLSDKPETCVNCHIMSPQYATWNHSSHRQYATCMDCHVPHNNIFNKYLFKAKDGMRHASMFALRLEPQVIFIKQAGKKVVHDNCIRCHNYLLTDEKMKLQSEMFMQIRNGRSCVDCHRETPHGRVRSLSSVPYAMIPLPESPVPKWMKKLTENPD
jgi:cytochrome c nitrite reductase small subunit